jgi:hypothetical protein
MISSLELPVSQGITFIHHPWPGTGKTKDMAKGLFLSYNGRLCAGESAGFGLPVLKRHGLTYFPSLTGAISQGSECIVKEFTLDRKLLWTIQGRKAPSWFAPMLERLVDAFMGLPRLQHPLLKARDFAFALFNIRPTMVQSASQGRCIVTYGRLDDGLRITVQWSPFNPHENLTIMNEVDGRSFNRLRIGPDVQEDHMIPSWFSVPFGAVLESPQMGIGVHMAPEVMGDEQYLGLFCGREVSTELDWAGFAVQCNKPFFSYLIRVRSG